MTATRRDFLSTIGALSAVGLAMIGTARTAFAHHGWRWTDSGEFELRGYIVEADLGFPHGILKVDANKEIWTVEVGQPWRNEQAGLSETDLAPGVDATFLGHRSSDSAELVMKAERIIIGGKRHDLYPNRS